MHTVNKPNRFSSINPCKKVKENRNFLYEEQVKTRIYRFDEQK